MKHILNDEQKDEFLRKIGQTYRNFKAINMGNWTHESAYRQGIVDICDDLIFVSSEITFEVSALRYDIECMFDKIDNETDSESIETWKCDKCGTDCSATTCPSDEDSDDDSFERDWCDFCEMIVILVPAEEYTKGTCPYCGTYI